MRDLLRREELFLLNVILVKLKRKELAGLSSQGEGSVGLPAQAAVPATRPQISGRKLMDGVLWSTLKKNMIKSKKEYLLCSGCAREAWNTLIVSLENTQDCRLLQPTFFSLPVPASTAAPLVSLLSPPPSMPAGPNNSPWQLVAHQCPL